MASAFVQTNGRVIAGEGDPAGGDALVTNLSLFPINSLYVNNNTGKLWVRNEENLVVGDWVGASGGSSLFPETGTGIATGNVIGDLAGFTLKVQQAGNDFLSIDPTTNGEISRLQAYNVTGGDNDAFIQLATTDTNATFLQTAEFNASAKLASIAGFADATTSSITHTADTHTFNAGGVDFLEISAASGGSFIRGYHNTDDGNQGRLTTFANATTATFELKADFNDEVKLASIEGFADATTSTITHTADQHIFNLQNFANNAAAVTGGLSVGALYYTDTAGEGLVKIVL